MNLAESSLILFSFVIGNVVCKFILFKYFLQKNLEETMLNWQQWLYSNSSENDLIKITKPLTDIFDKFKYYLPYKGEIFMSRSCCDVLLFLYEG